MPTCQGSAEEDGLPSGSSSADNATANGGRIAGRGGCSGAVSTSTGSERRVRATTALFRTRRGAMAGSRPHYWALAADRPHVRHARRRREGRLAITKIAGVADDRQQGLTSSTQEGITDR